jgi:hypothetical protein
MSNKECRILKRSTSAVRNSLFDILNSNAEPDSKRTKSEGSRQLSGRGSLLLVAAWLIFVGATAMAAERDGRWAILLSGASGDPELQQTYLKELTDLYSTLTKSLGFPRNQVAVLFDDPSKNPEMIGRKATRENLQALCRELAGRVQKNDLMFVFIEGHGDYDGKIYKLNLVGPDPTGEELASMLYSIPAQRFVVINATNCSGGSLSALSRKEKIVITSTKSGMEKNQPHAARFFIDAFINNAADSNKDGRASIFEAFIYARQKVEEYYQNEASMQTEHAVMEDNGDGQAQQQPSPENGEGLLARTVFLDAGSSVDTSADLTPEQQELAREAQKIGSRIEALKYAKAEMPEADYQKKLEDLLIKLAQINAKLPK